MQKFETYDYVAEGCHLQTFGVLLAADQPKEAIDKYRKAETVFWNTWRGSFCGLLRDDTNDITLLFNDHIGSKMVFYAQTDDGLAWSRNLYELAHSIGAKADNENYLWQMLLYGYSPVGETVFKSISRLQAGEYIYAHGKDVEKRIYHRFDNTPNNLTIDENIERLDAAFRKAVERVIRKNEEYGYSHFVALSAGLDSRMVNRVARELAKTPIQHITYSQSGFYDEIVPKELAEFWQQQIHFTALDGGDCLCALEEVSRLTQGLIHYSGAAETLGGLPQIARKDCGIFLTGMVGDIIVGTAYTQRKQEQSYHVGEGAIIHGFNEKLRCSLPGDFEQLYPNRELYYLYVRGFNCANLGSPLVHQAFGESYSPFCDVDVITAAYAAPLEQRWGHKLYDRWIVTKYPDMTQWKHNGEYTIGHRPCMVSLFGRVIPLHDVPKRMAWAMLKRLHIHDFYKEVEGKSMTPEDDWFAHNETLSRWQQSYVEENMGLLNDFPDIRKMALHFNRGNAMERMQVLSLLACLRQAR